jgi:hypothetical protein
MGRHVTEDTTENEQTKEEQTLFHSPTPTNVTIKNVLGMKMESGTFSELMPLFVQKPILVNGRKKTAFLGSLRCHSWPAPLKIQ